MWVLAFLELSFGFLISVLQKNLLSFDKFLSFKKIFGKFFDILGIFLSNFWLLGEILTKIDEKHTKNAKKTIIVPKICLKCHITSFLNWVTKNSYFYKFRISQFCGFFSVSRKILALSFENFCEKKPDLMGKVVSNIFDIFQYEL